MHPHSCAWGKVWVKSLNSQRSLGVHQCTPLKNDESKGSERPTAGRPVQICLPQHFPNLASPFLNTIPSKMVSSTPLPLPTAMVISLPWDRFMSSPESLWYSAEIAFFGTCLCKCWIFISVPSRADHPLLPWASSSSSLVTSVTHGCCGNHALTQVKDLTRCLAYSRSSINLSSFPPLSQQFLVYPDIET